MIYKKYEISLSLNGENIMHIARNYAGVVIFRAETEEDVKTMIDKSIFEQEKREKEIEEAKKKKEEAKEKKAKRGLFQAPVEEETVATEQHETVEEDIKTEDESVLTPPQSRVTRGPDGKFISKSKLQEQSEEEKKKSFWDKLTS